MTNFLLEGGGYLGDPGRAHRCFNKKTFFIGFYIFMHRLPAPSVPELALSYYSYGLNVGQKIKVLICISFSCPPLLVEQR